MYNFYKVESEHIFCAIILKYTRIITIMCPLTYIHKKVQAFYSIIIEHDPVNLCTGTHIIMFYVAR